jgi:LysM repeat protein
VNGRIRITNAKSRVGISGQVTGWIDKPSDVGYIVYVVQAGDTLRKIATRYSSTIAKIGEINNLTNLDLIRVGQKLKIPV